MLLLLYPEYDFQVNISLTQDMLCCLRSIVEIVCMFNLNFLLMWMEGQYSQSFLL